MSQELLQVLILSITLLDQEFLQGLNMFMTMSQELLQVLGLNECEPRITSSTHFGCNGEARIPSSVRFGVTVSQELL